MKQLSFLLALFFSLLLTQSCQKDNEIDPLAGQEAPALPSEESFIMSLTQFTEMGGLDEGEVDSRTVTNWSHAAGNVLIWNSLLSLHLTIPVLSFQEAFNHQPVYQGQGVWLWAYEVTDDTGTYQAELYGELLVNDEVKWDMYISKTGGFSNVHWYTGITALDESYAHWTLNFDVTDPKPFISIDYLRDNGNGVSSIRYTNIIPGNPDNGSYIEYRTGNVVPGEFDRAYDVFGAADNNLIEINWNSVNHNGRVKNPDFYGDEDWHCWDTQLQDVDC
ncbi:MAG: hypothetical protein Kow0027_14050 [Saprospiraceae bacterium]